MSSAGDAPSTSNPTSHDFSRNMKLLIVMLTITGFVLAGVSLAHSLGAFSFPSQSKPNLITVFGTVAANFTGASQPTVTFIDMSYPAQSVSTSVTSGFYNLTVHNQRSYNIHLYYSYQTNNCYTNQAGNYVCLVEPENCYKGPITIDTSSAFMQYNIDCTHG